MTNKMQQFNWPTNPVLSVRISQSIKEKNIKLNGCNNFIKLFSHNLAICLSILMSLRFPFSENMPSYSSNSLI